MNLLHPTSDMMESWRKTWQAPLSSFCPRWWRWTWSWLLSCIFNTIGHCSLLPHHCQVFKLPPAGAGEEEDRRAWLFHRALNHPCRLLLLQGCQKKITFFVNFPFAQAASGFIYPLERGMIFIYKPPIFVKYEDIQSINFARYLYLKCTGGKWQILVLFVAYFSSLRFSGQAEPTDHLILR